MSPRLRWLAILALCLPLPTWAAGLAPMERCLEQFDLSCAETASRLVQGEEDNLRAELWLAFHQGDYAQVQQLTERLASLGVDLDAEEPSVPYRATANAARGMIERVEEGLRIRTAPGVEQILQEDATEVLSRSRSTYDRLFGGGPEHDVVLDIFPTATRFIDASGLPPESVRTTGVIALSKWTRLLLTSPRALSRGYAWKDTVAHEYIHLVVAYRTENRAPVWLQEGLAKHLEGRWRGDTTGALGAHTEALLAKAIHTDTFVPFEKFARSMAYLDSGEEAALAFGQVATMVQFLLSKAGNDALPPLMDRIRDGEDPFLVTASLAGYPDFDSFRLGWQNYIRTLPLVERQLATLPVVLDGEGDDAASDPLLAGRPDLARFYRLGDLLRDAGHHKAALIEYAKAQDPKAPPSPLLLSREALCYEALGQLPQALGLTREGTALYPEFTLLQKTHGRLLRATGDDRAAITAYQAAHDLNPFDPEVERALVDLHQRTGQTTLAARHLAALRVLETSGAANAPPSNP